jgi:hypothetical protein
MRVPQKQPCVPLALDQNCAGVEQLEAVALHVLMRLGPWLRGDNGQLTAGCRSVGEPGRQQSGLDTPPAVLRYRCRAGELRYVRCHPEAGGADDYAVTKGEVANGSGRREILLSADEDLARELFVRRHSLAIGVSEAFDYDAEPGFGLPCTTPAYLDPRWRDPHRRVGESQTEHVLERGEPVAPAGQERADCRVTEVRELDLHRSTAGSKGLLNRTQRSFGWHATEAKPGYLIERRALVGEARHAARDSGHEAGGCSPAPASCFAGRSDELRLGPLNTRRQGNVAEQGRSASGHPDSLVRTTLESPPRCPQDTKAFPSVTTLLFSGCWFVVFVPVQLTSI